LSTSEDWLLRYIRTYLYFDLTVVKFKRRARYLEFFVQVADKALSEEAADLALDWCLDTSQWLNK